MVEEIRRSPDFSVDSGGHVPTLLPEDSDSESDSEESGTSDASVIAAGDVVDPPLCPEGVDVHPPERGILSPPVPPIPPAPDPVAP